MFSFKLSTFSRLKSTVQFRNRNIVSRVLENKPASCFLLANLLRNYYLQHKSIYPASVFGHFCFFGGRQLFKKNTHSSIGTNFLSLHASDTNNSRVTTHLHLGRNRDFIPIIGLSLVLIVKE